jgi:hypothetical protein
MRAAAEPVHAPVRPASASVQDAGLLRLRDIASVRERCRLVREWVATGRSPHFTLQEDRLEMVAGYVADVTRSNYPELEIPYHSRWRHFSAGGIDRWAELTAIGDAEAAERARSAVDLATVSVLLDAGAGDAWRYREPQTGLVYARSEGLAVASIHMFRSGGFSSDPRKPFRVDAGALGKIDTAALARHFQADAGNPLTGLEQRAALLRGLASAVAERAALFGEAPARPGNLVDHLWSIAPDGHVAAATVLFTLLDALSSIWPSGLVLDGFPIGDAGFHPAIVTDDASTHVVPFHKLSQWLTYSLVEPLETAGLVVEGIDALTALPEYRNGGLLIDLGVIRARTPIDPRLRYDTSSEPIVEWRALTVALMDALLERVRQKLGLDAGFAMPHLLQGGTWSAGRKIAIELRPPDGPPPIPIAADGTVF